LPYAEVCVNSPAASRPAFSYSIPANLDVQAGQAVWVPFGRQILQGIVIETSRIPGYPETRDITGIIGTTPVLSAASIKLGKWIAGYYRCPLFQALGLMLPPGFERRSIGLLCPAEKNAQPVPLSLGDDERQLLEKLNRSGPLQIKDIEKMLGARRAQRAVSSLVKLELACRQFETEPVRVKPRQDTFVELNAGTRSNHETIDKLMKKAPRQAAVLEYLFNHPGPVLWRLVNRDTAASTAVRKDLAEKGLILVSKQQVNRRPIPEVEALAEKPLTPTGPQAHALNNITESLKRNLGQIFLLHGVTGSGKTEVYLQALAETIRLGRKAIVLVPEISLTPQTIERFTARFPNQVAVLHSRLSLGEQFDQWQEIRRGSYSVVIGPRSALFAPLPDLGLVVIDEEHEWSYKQDNSPRYHARRVAVEMCRLHQATLVLGSATPDVESYYQASRGEYRLLSLPDRLAPRVSPALPEVEVVDLREELKSGNRSIFSRSLQNELAGTLSRKEQAMLFLNRRGGATFIQCRSCGHVLGCRRCRVSLSYHFEEESLVCHHCNYRQPVPQVCPECSSRKIKYLGAGTQAVAAEVAALFPAARVIRWDSDTTRLKNGHRDFLHTFREGRADIIIGTQMIAKGLDFPGVSLVGVINADIGLNLPDFRAGERTFSLLSQVAGRAGRGSAPGKVIIQSYCPGHYSIQAAARHDYAAFYTRELAYRRELYQPPFSRLVRLTFAHTNDEFCQREALRLKTEFEQQRDCQGIAGISLIGPAPAFLHRLRGRYRWSLYIKGSQPAQLLEQVELPARWKVDVDPLGLE